MADALDSKADELATLADTETALGMTRLTGEVARTTGQLEVTTGDRDRRTDRVRGVPEELSLALQAGPALVGHLLDLPLRGGPAPGMPHHRDEQRRHQWDLREFGVVDLRLPDKLYLRKRSGDQLQGPV